MAKSSRSHASTWSYKAGECGRNRIRLSVDPKRSGRLFVEFRERDGRKVRQYLTHTNRERAKQEADAMAAAFGTEPPMERNAPLTLQALFDIYVREVTPTKAEGTRYHDRSAVQLFLRCFGTDRNPSTIGLREWHRFIVERRSGYLAPKGPQGTPRKKKIGDRQVAYDLKLLLSIFNWATLAGDGKGGVLLDRNPCKGFPLPSEARPRRPRMPDDRYQRMVAVADAVHADFRLALVLAYETGHRLSSIRQLRWSDILWDRKMVCWRGETDKEGNHHLTPLSEGARRCLTEARQRTTAIGNAFVFPNDRGEDVRERGRFRAWWLRAEKLANLDHDDHWGWHSLRRKFATELKDIPLKDLCDLGGWRSPQTILTCYQESDEETMRRALLNRRPIGAPERKMESRNGEHIAQS
ncbi:MAG: site-specific integrase [Gemmatimonadota bacterium]|nr:site-specific integrase [Gemmatimonadota bacterium]